LNYSRIRALLLFNALQTQTATKKRIRMKVLSMLSILMLLICVPISVNAVDVPDQQIEVNDSLEFQMVPAIEINLINSFDFIASGDIVMNMKDYDSELFTLASEKSHSTFIHNYIGKHYYVNRCSNDLK